MRVVCRPIDWTIPPTLPAEDECHVWTVRLEQGCPFDWLTADERERADRYKLPRLREQFRTARNALRFVLGGCLGSAPELIPIVLDGHGKPGVPGDPLFFNVSHSGDLGLVAVCRWRVGVDVEREREVPNAAGLVGRWFSAEERDAFERLPTEKRSAGFLRGWTCKEAVLKAVGIGLRDVQECWVELDPDKPPAVHRLAWPAAAGRRWELTAWRPADGYVAAVAVESEASRAA